ncbi:MAG: hypothetical protein WCG44_03825 [bacterium]
MENEQQLRQVLAQIIDGSSLLWDTYGDKPLVVNGIRNILYSILENPFTLEQLADINKEWAQKEGEELQVNANNEALKYVREVLKIK